MSYEATRTVSSLNTRSAARSKWVLSVLSVVLTSALVVVLHSGI